jgi:hypothetical protein
MKPVAFTALMFFFLTATVGIVESSSPQSGGAPVSRGPGTSRRQTPRQRSIVAQDLGPSIVSVSGRQLIVSKRNPDGTLATPAPYIIRGVDWSPASQSTTGTTDDRRAAFGQWKDTDAPQMSAMNVNTVRTYLDVGTDSTGTAVLDQLYANGIMVMMTVDDGVNDLSRIQQAVTFFKGHPAVLGWVIGSEWNINLYFGHATSVADAAQRTETAASLIRSLDSNHPVVTSYGEIDINQTGNHLSDTRSYVNTVCPDVDLWALNIYRGNTFGTLFGQWGTISTKPMLIGEFGTDTFRSFDTNHPPPGFVDQTMQTQWDLSEWGHLSNNLSANDPANVAVGGFVFEWNDEWWKVAPSGQQDTDGCGPPDCNGHPDHFANEEYFGIVDINRQPRAVYAALKTAFAPGPQPKSISFRAVSRGFTAAELQFQNGVARLYKDGAVFYEATGGGGGGRGFNIAAIDTCTGIPIASVQHFDTWDSIHNGNGSAFCDMSNFLDSLPNGTLIMMSVADEAGLDSFSSCNQIANSCLALFLQKMDALGSQKIRSYCYQNSWAMIAVKGEGAARDESLAAGTAEASAQTTIPVLASLSPMSQFFSAGGGNSSVSVTLPGGCNWSATTQSIWITITTGAGTGSGSATYSVAPNGTGSPRFDTVTIAGLAFTVSQAPTCSNSISPGNSNFAASGGAGSVSVTAYPACPWTASSNATFITITSGASGTGNGMVAYSVALNTSSNPRMGTMTIAGQTFTVSQSGNSSLAPRAFVSGRGSDSNPCSIGSPCRTIGVAIGAVLSGGEVVVLNSAGYGPFAVDRAVTIIAPQGVYAGVSVASGDGITISVGPSDTVILRGLFLNGVGGANGITFNSGQALFVERCVINGFLANGLNFSGGGSLFAKDSVIRNNAGAGIRLSGTMPVLALASIDRVRLEANGTGLAVSDSAKASVRNSVFSGNATGLAVMPASLPAEINVDRCLIANNGTGALAQGSGGTGTLRISKCTISENGLGLSQQTGGVLLSGGRNKLGGNTTDSAGTIGNYTVR